LRGELVKLNIYVTIFKLYDSSSGSVEPNEPIQVARKLYQVKLELQKWFILNLNFELSSDKFDSTQLYIYLAQYKWQILILVLKKKCEVVIRGCGYCP
jgi:hypothetical protein